MGFAGMLVMPQQQSIMNQSRRVKLSKDRPCTAILLLLSSAVKGAWVMDTALKECWSLKWPQQRTAAADIDSYMNAHDGASRHIGHATAAMHHEPLQACKPPQGCPATLLSSVVKNKKTTQTRGNG